MAFEDAKAVSHPPTEDLTLSNLQTVQAVQLLGTLAVAGIKQFGQATFVLRPDGGIAFANPVHVHVHPDAVPDLADKPYRLLRPILGSGRPQFVVWKDGILWELEFVDESDANDKKIG